VGKLGPVTELDLIREELATVERGCVGTATPAGVGAAFRSFLSLANLSGLSTSYSSTSSEGHVLDAWKYL
jgi:hypothetical protein